eukprot:scaffold7330_cov146-Cylindrotheca_fusiformis.AAC.16
MKDEKPNTAETPATQEAPPAEPEAPPNGKSPKKPGIVKNGIHRASAITYHGIDKATNGFDKAVEMTNHSLERAATITQRNVGKVVKPVESVYETSPWCCFARYVAKFPKYWPRTFSLIFGVVLPLWILILIAAGFGIILASAESVEEQAS